MARVGAELHRDTPAIPTKPTSKTRWRDPRCSRQQRAWQHGKLGRAMGVGAPGGGRLETRQSHGFKISRLNLAGPCRRLDGLGCCPALRLLGAPFPDPSSTTTHTTHTHGTRRPSSSKRPWLEPGTTEWEPASWPFLDGDRRLRPRGCHTLVARSRRRRCASKDMAPPFCSCRWGRAVDGPPSSINRSTTSTVFPRVYRPLMISGACRRLLPVPPRRVMPDRDITAPQSLAQGYGLARDRHGHHGCLSSNNNRGTSRPQKKTHYSTALRRLLGRPLVARQPSTPLMHARVGFSIWTSGIF